VVYFIVTSLQAKQIPFSYETKNLEDYYEKIKYSDSELE
jgi:hypothetical protein